MLKLPPRVDVSSRIYQPHTFGLQVRNALVSMVWWSV